MHNLFGILRARLERMAQRLREAGAARGAPVRIVFRAHAALAERLGLVSCESQSAEAQAETQLAEWLQAHARFPLGWDEVLPALDWIERHRPDWSRGWQQQYPSGVREVTVQGKAIALTDIDSQVRSIAPQTDILYPMCAQQLGFWPRWVLAGLARGDGLAEQAAFLLRWQRGVEEGTNPIAYVDNLQVVFRLVSLLTALPFVLAAGNGALAARCASIIAADAGYVRAHLGESYPNNHLLGDLFGLSFLDLVLPELGAAGGEELMPSWYAQCERQLYADGTSFEHSTHYHELVCQMMVCFRRGAQLAGVTPPPSFEALLHKALAFQVAVHADERTPLQIGDSAEDSLLPLAPAGCWSTAALAGLHEAWYPQVPCPAVTGASEQAAFWLLGGSLPEKPLETPRAALDAFPCGGLFVMHDETMDSRLVFRTGPAPGLALNPGHMHADLLSVTLTVKGRPLLVDAGTGSYRSQPRARPGGPPPWREYLMSARAHNGLALDGLDPLLRGDGDFPGSIHDRVPVQSWMVLEASRAAAGLGLVVARNDGTSAYRDHRRGVLHIHGSGWLVWDRLPGAGGDAAASIGWQLPPGSGVAGVDAACHRLEGAASSALLVAAGTQPAILCHGDRQPMGGWYSAHYGAIEPAPQLRHPIASTAALVAFAVLPQASGTAALAIDAQPGGVRLRLDLATEHWTVWLAAEGAMRVEAPAVRFSGQVLFLRGTAAGPVEVRALGATELVVPALDLALSGDAAVDVRRSAVGGEPGGI